jgi:S-formylglutathione hydrolase FrmB
MKTNKLLIFFRFLLLLNFFSLCIFSQNGKIISETVHGKSLENTVTKENPDRRVSIYLPPGYEKSSTKRFPVVYLLHGIGDTDQTWVKAWSEKNDGYATILDLMDKGIAAGKFGEMIVVMPDEKTNWFGSFYVNSTATGNWEDFTSKELVDFIDKKYRTLANVNHRGIAGHSMGGFGAITLAMKHPETFSVAYGMNPAIMDWGGDLNIDLPAFAFVLKAKSYDELLKTGEIYNIGIVTVAQAFSPNPDKPPFYADLPFKLENGQMIPDEPGFSKWRENSVIRMVVKYRSNLMKLRGLKFDSGYEDEFKFIPVNSRLLSNELTNNGIEHIFEEYNGDHRNRLWSKKGRLYNEIFPYFWELLKD